MTHLRVLSTQLAALVLGHTFITALAAFLQRFGHVLQSSGTCVIVVMAREVHKNARNSNAAAKKLLVSRSPQMLTA